MPCATQHDMCGPGLDRRLLASLVLNICQSIKLLHMLEVWQMHVFLLMETHCMSFFKTIFNLLETLNAPQCPQTCSWKDRCFKNATEFKKVFESNWVNVQVAYKQPKSAAKLSKSQLVNRWSADLNILKCAWRCPWIKREIGRTFLSYHHQ